MRLYDFDEFVNDFSNKLPIELINDFNVIRNHIEQLEQALDKIYEVIDDITKDNVQEFCPATKFDWLPCNCNEHTCENGTKECWKEWALQNRKQHP